MPRCWSTAPGGHSSRGSSSARPPCGERSADWVGRRKKVAGSRAERDEQARAAWRAAVARRDAQQFVFVDESSTHTSLTRLYGWAPHDQRAAGSVPRNHGHNTTLVAALTPDGLHEPWLLEGAMNTETFAWYIQEQLAPRLRPGQVVVLDNLSAHKAARIRQALEARVAASCSSCRPTRPTSRRSSRRSPSSRRSCAGWVRTPTRH